MANSLQRLMFIFAGLFLFSSPGLAVDNFKEFKRDQWDFDLGAQFFHSEANYPSSGGGTQDLANGNHYQLLDVTFGTRYAPRREWSIFGWGTVGNAESKNSVVTRTNSTMSEAAAGFDFVMYSDLFQLIPEIIAVMPFEKVDPTTDDVLNSEGVFEVRSRLIAQKEFGKLRGYGWLGFNYRGEGRSFLMPWGVGTQLKFKRFHLGAEVLGYESVSEDTDKNNVLRTAYISTANAGSLKFYSTDPSLVDTQIYASWLVTSKFSLHAHGGMTLTGSNSASGYHMGGFLRYSFDMTEGYSEMSPVAPIESEVPTDRSNMYEESDLSSERKVRRFRESIEDGVDQGIFKGQPTSKPEQKSNVKPQKRLNEDDLQRQLDETEFNVELKAKKKKAR